MINEEVFAESVISPFTDMIIMTKIGLVNNSKVILGDIPEATYREMIADAVPLKDLKKMFEHVVANTLKL